MKNVREKLELAAYIAEVNQKEDAEKFGEKHQMENELK